MTALARVLGEAGRGVHVWRSERPLSGVRAEAEEIGWRCVVVDGSAVTGKVSFLDECERAYQFPYYFGRTWDAFAD
ncbi:MAG: barstar family protein, partial [Catenulispora sp.]